MAYSISRKLRLAALGVAGIAALACCGVGGQYAHYHVMTHTYTYEGEVTALDRATVAVDVRPSLRLHGPDRLVGPPYEVMLNVQDPTGRTMAATLHSIHIDYENSESIAGVVSNGRRDSQPTPQGGCMTLLYGQFPIGDWGTRPTLIADVEIELDAGRGVRQTLSIPLRPKNRAELYIP